MANDARIVRDENNRFSIVSDFPVRDWRNWRTRNERSLAANSGHPRLPSLERFRGC